MAHMDWIVLRNVTVIGIMLTVMTMLLDNAIVTRDGMALDVIASVTKANAGQNVATFVIRIILPVILSIVYAYVRESGQERTVVKYALLDILVITVQKLLHYVLMAMVPVILLLVLAIVMKIQRFMLVLNKKTRLGREIKTVKRLDL
ncbi:hypothetical protein NPIL_643581 [Nephila pilipes]|uniref:Uncharacterized protein n=1 Tax=Nephila pilipes TaxID=299642 RepID=A0A8X6UMF0_NEPPI|nr:hypothetical protein NPIL_643581 [Nephila pilipes]